MGTFILESKVSCAWGLGFGMNYHFQERGY